MQRKMESLFDNDEYGMKILNSGWYQTLFCLQDVFVKASMEFYTAKGLSYIPLPVTTKAISSPMGLGSDSLPVEVIMKNEKIFLADSMQFLLEYAIRMANKGSFYLMPSFRGEPTDDRHLSQFFHSEAEIKGNLEDVIRFVEEYVWFLSRKILEEVGDKVEQYAGTTKHIEYMAQSPVIPRVTYEKALEGLKNVEGSIDVIAPNIQVINKFGEEHLMKMYGGYLWLTNFDARIVPFYQANDGRYAYNADLLMGIGETVGAGERHKTAQQVRKALMEHQVKDMEAYNWYIQMKELYPMKTSGFGMGMERFLLWVMQHNDIRDCQIISRIDGSKMEP